MLSQLSLYSSCDVAFRVIPLHRPTITRQLYRLHFARVVHSRHRFPPIGDAVYRQHAGGDRATDIGNKHKNLIKIARVVPEISSRTDRQTQTDILITILRYFETTLAGEVVNMPTN